MEGPGKTSENKTEKGIDKFILAISGKLAKIPEMVVSRRWTFFSVILAVVVILSTGIMKLHINESFEDFFTEGNTSAANYRLFRNTFGSDESLVLIYKPVSGDIFSPDSLKKVKAFEDKINEERIDPKSPLNRITRVRSIVSADFLETRGNTMISRKFIGDNIPKSEKEVESLRKAAMKQKDYSGTFFSKDFKYGLITLTTDFGTRLAKTDKDSKNEIKEEAPAEFDFESTGTEKTDKKEAKPVANDKAKYEQLQPTDYVPTMKAIRDILTEQGWTPVYHQFGITLEPESGKDAYAMAGNPWLQEFIQLLFEIDVNMMMGISLGITFFMLALSFRSLSAMVWPFVIIVMSETTTIGLSSYLGIPGSTMLSIVLFLILTLGVASSVHILSGFKIFIEEGMTKMEALSTVYRKSGFSIILAAVTTMGGLFALAIMPLIPIRNFGITASLGILIALLLTLYLLPILLSFWSPYKTGSEEKLKANPIEKWFQKILSGIQNTVLNRPVTVMIVFLVFTAFFLAGIPRIKIDTSFANMTRVGHGITETFNLIDKYFGGGSSVEIMVDSGKTEGVRNVEIIRAMDKLTQTVLTEKPQFVPRAFSLVNAVKDSYRLLNDGTDRYYKIPDTNEKLGQVMVMYDSADPETRKLMVDDDWRIARISMQVTTKSSYEYNSFLDDLNKWIDQDFNPLKKEFPDLKITVTGSVPIMMGVVDFISYSQIRSFAFALIIVSMIIFIIYGSVRFGIIAIIPNLVPMAVIGGLAGWLNLEFDTDTLICMPLAIGVVVDDTIHFLTHYRAELAHGKNAREAITISLREVGQAMMFTSFILAGGFLVFIGSVYIPFNKFGLLSGGAIISALLADLFLLPSLLVIFYTEKTGKKESEKSGLLQKTKMAIVLIIFIILAIFLAQPASAAPALKNPEKARQIMEKAVNIDDGKSSYNETIMITCAYKEDNGKRTCTSEPRKKEFESVGNDTGKDGKDSISISILTAPASEKNMAFLQKDYDDENKDSDQWMYLPAMKKMKRIVAESENGPKTGTIFGSEFAYEDIEKPKLNDYDYSLVGEETYEGKKVWIIESYPRQRRLSKTSYGKSVNWIDQESYISLKTELYDKQFHLKKTIYTRNVENHSGAWIARQIIVVNHQNKRMSMMKINKLAINIRVDEGIYTTRALEETGYREKILGPIRSKAK